MKERARRFLLTTGGFRLETPELQSRTRARKQVYFFLRFGAPARGRPVTQKSPSRAGEKRRTPVNAGVAKLRQLTAQAPFVFLPKLAVVLDRVWHVLAAQDGQRVAAGFQPVDHFQHQ